MVLERGSAPLKDPRTPKFRSRALRWAARAPGTRPGHRHYLTKPFGTDELMARVRALLRRSGQGSPGPTLFRDGDLDIDLTTHRVTRAGAEIRLTKTEWSLVETMAQHPGKLLTHDWLLDRVWGAGYEGGLDVLRVFISQIRGKIEGNPRSPLIIATDPGIGYRWLLRPAEPPD